MSFYIVGQGWAINFLNKIYKLKFFKLEIKSMIASPIRN